MVDQVIGGTGGGACGACGQFSDNCHCFTTPRISFETPDARVCRRCDRKAYEHVEVAGIGLVCPVHITTFTPDTK